MPAIAEYKEPNLGWALCSIETDNDPDRYAHRDSKVDCSGMYVLGRHRGAFKDVVIFDIPTPGQVEDEFIATLEEQVEEEDEPDQLDSEDVEELTAEGVAWVVETYWHVWYEREIKTIRDPLDQWAERAENDDAALPRCIGSRVATTLEYGDEWWFWGSFYGENGQHQSWKVGTRASRQWARHEKTKTSDRAPWSPAIDVVLTEEDRARTHECVEWDEIYAVMREPGFWNEISLRDASGVEYVDEWESLSHDLADYPTFEIGFISRRAA